MSLKITDIPASLWVDDALHVPPGLLAVHVRDLEREGLLDTAKQRGGPIGGASLEEFRQHYARLFRTGVCRVCGVLLDPSRKFAEIPHDLQTSLTAGRVCIIDAPSGACTASLGILGALLELRQRSVLPQLPLNVQVLAADISTHALAKAQELLGALSGPLDAVGITTTLQTMAWDATAPDQTASLIAWVKAMALPSADHLAVWESFSGATSPDREDESSAIFPRFSGSIAQLISALGTPDPVTFLWIEPRSKGSRRLITRIADLVEALRLKRPSDNHEHIYHWYNSLLAMTHECNVRILRYVRA